METPIICPVAGNKESCLQYLCPAYNQIHEIWQMALARHPNNPDKAVNLFFTTFHSYIALRLIVPDRDCHVLLQADQN